MAKSIKQIEEELKALRDEQKQIRANAKEYQKLKNSTTELTEVQKLKLKLLEEEHKKYEQNSKSIDNLNKRLDHTKKQIRDATADTGELDNAFISISNAIGKSNDYTTLLGATFSKTLQTAESISTELQKGAGGSVENTKAIEKALSAYKTMQVSIAQANKLYIQGKITNEERVRAIKDESDAFKDVADSINMSEVSSDELKNGIQAIVKEGKSFGEAMKSAQLQTQALDNVFGSFSGIPAMGEMNTLLKTNIKDTLAWKAAIFAVGAALGKAAFDYFGAPIKAGMQADKERQQNEIDTIANVAKIKEEAEFIPAQIAQDRRELEINNAHEVARVQHEAAYAGVKAAHEFSVQMQQGAAAFERAAKTALFGNKLGSVGYGAAQLQLAGISADKIASAMQAASAATGKMPSARVGADMAIMAERTGQSVDDIASINEYLQRTEKVSEGVAMNLQEGMRAMADKAGISLGKLMKDIAESSKDALSYNIKSAKELAKQVAYASSIGVNFGDIAKAGKNMVMNYKDSIKAEMQLSTLLGEQVDLSEVRAKFAAGDTEGAMEALKAQGLDPATMDMFQQQALSDALGGLDLSSISKIAQNTGAQVGALEGASAQKGGQEFLGKTEAAEQALNAKQASISAQSAIFDAKLSGEIAKSFLDSDAEKKFREDTNKAAQAAATLEGKMRDLWLQSDAYKKSLSDTMKLDFLSSLKENLVSGLVATIGGAITSGLAGTLTKGMGGVWKSMTGLFGKGGKGGGGGADAPSAPGGGGGVGDVKTGADPMQSVAGKAGKGKNIISTILDSLKSIIKSISGVLQEGLKLVKDVGGKLIDTAGSLLKKSIGLVKDTLNELIKGVGSVLQNALGTLESVGTKAVKVLGNIGGQIVDSVSSILKKGQPIVETIGKMFETLGKSIAKVAGSLGSAVGNLLRGVFQGIAAGMAAWANPAVAIGAAVFAAAILVIGAAIAGATWMVGKALPTMAAGMKSFEELNGAKLKEAGIGIAAIGGGLAVFGVGGIAAGVGGMVGALTGAIGKLFGAKSPIDQLKEFSDLKIDGKRVKENAEAFAAFGVAMTKSGIGSAASGIGTLVGGLAEGIGKFFGAKPPLDKFYDFAHTDFGDPQKTMMNAQAFSMFGQAMASYKGTGESGWSKLASGIAGFFGGGGGSAISGVLADFREFATADMGDTTKLKANAEAFSMFGQAMASYKGTGESGWSKLGNGIVSFFTGGGGSAVSKVLGDFKEFAAADLGDVAKLKANAEAFTMFGQAMASYKPPEKPGMWGTLSEGVGKFLGVETPLDKFKAFAAVTGIDPERVKINADAFTMFGNAMASYKGTSEPSGWAALGKGIGDFFSGGKVDIINEFQRFAALDSTGIIDSSNAIATLNTNLAGYSSDTAESVGTSLSSFSETVAAADLTSIGTAMGDLNEQMSTLAGNVTALGNVATMMDTTAAAIINLTTALNGLANVDTKMINDLPWIRMTAFSAAGGRITLAQSATGNFNLTQDTAKNIADMKTADKTNSDQFKKDNSEMIRLTKNLQALIAVLADSGQAAFQLNIDGSAVTNMIKRRMDNRAPGTPTNGGDPSDITLKHNIQLIGKSEAGINIYTFEYVEKVGMPGLYQGVMAQELIGTEYESALIFDGEYYKVDYSKLDVEFIRIN